MQFRLETLLIVLALGPMVLAIAFPAIEERVQQKEVAELLRKAGAK